MMATLGRFIALLLARTMEGARSHRKTGTHFSGSRSKPGFRQAPMAPKKEARPKGPGTLLVAAQYSQESLTNNGLMAAWLADFGGKTDESGGKSPKPRSINAGRRESLPGSASH